VLSGTDVTMMGSVGVTTLQPQGAGDSKLPLTTDVVSSSSEDSPRVERKEGDPL
jgi:hypothetical protein